LRATDIGNGGAGRLGIARQRYFDVASPGRTVGLDEESGKQKTAGR
jgi:hypothetical protein